ncbi:hypothetical protein EVAR_71763_1, partial [Eumeta japonica]
MSLIDEGDNFNSNQHTVQQQTNHNSYTSTQQPQHDTKQQPQQHAQDSFEDSQQPQQTMQAPSSNTYATPSVEDKFSQPLLVQNYITELQQRPGAKANKGQLSTTFYNFASDNTAVAFDNPLETKTPAPAEPLYSRPTAAYNPEPPVIQADDKLDSFVLSTAQSLALATPTQESLSYDPPVYISAGSPLKLPGHPSSMDTKTRPGFFSGSTEGLYPVPTDDKPAFPGYYGPTPTYPAFQVPGEKLESPIEEQVYTSPIDFINFPPVRNPNLNLSATSSAVTNDFELSTPAFVEDNILKNKMNTLVHKIVESLQGNFEALANMLDENNNTAAVQTYQASPLGSTAEATKKPTRKPVTKVTTAKPKATTKKPITRITSKTPTKKPGTTRKPETTTKRQVVRRTTTTTKRPASRNQPANYHNYKIPNEDDFVDEE